MDLKNYFPCPDAYRSGHPLKKRITKTLLIMKLTAIILISACLTASANGHSQNVTLTVKDAPLEKVFTEIKKQTGYRFFYESQILENARKVSITIKNGTLDQVLALCLQNQLLEYIIIKKTIVIKQKPASPNDQITVEFSPIDIVVRGKVLNEKGQVLPGATIQVKGTTKASYIVNAGSSGTFSIIVPGSEAVLIVSYVGYKTKEVVVSGADVDLVIYLELEITKLQDVSVVSTGYQTLPKERSTGSFGKIDNETFNYRAGADIISRMEDMTPGILINRRGIGGSTANIFNMTVRGPSDLGYSNYSDNAPLVVLDNAPYSGNVANLNPNDIESITILKDAAATSIYGAKAANGVIVVTTKQAALKRPFQLQVFANVTIAEKPDLYYSTPTLGSSTFIDLEKQLFATGYFDGDINSGVILLSPVVELLRQVRDNGFPAATANQQIDAMRQYDYRKDILKYGYRNEINQQYAVNFSQGADKFGYYLSAGLDRGNAGLPGTVKNRITIRSNTRVNPVQNLEFNLGVMFTQNNVDNPLFLGWTNPPNAEFSGVGSYYPYARLADESGNPLALPDNWGLAWAEQQGNLRGLDWTFIPLNDRGQSQNNSNSLDILLNFSAEYKIFNGLKFKGLYQYEKATGKSETFHKANSYYTRNEINSVTQSPGPNQVRPIPLGAIIDGINYSTLISHTARLQLDFDKTIGNKHSINAIAGVELRENRSKDEFPQSIFGYDEESGASQPVDITRTYPNYYGFPALFASPGNVSGSVFRGISAYANAAYVYDNRYLFNVSARKDGSNLFGVKTNQKFNPTSSVGAGWNISKEGFYKVNWLPYLKLRATYGYAGNIASNTSAYLTSTSYGINQFTGLAYSFITQLPNEKLRWSETGILNIGFDFKTTNNWLNGSVEYFTKKSKDVLSPVNLDPTTGFSNQVLNVGTLLGKGVELALSSTILKKGSFEWNSNFLFTYNKTKVIKNNSPVFPESLPSNGVGVNVPEGYDAYGLFSFRFAGLDPVTGDPQGYVNGTLTSANGYPGSFELTNPDSLSELVYHGPQLPVFYGALRNSFSWKNFSFSFNITYKLGYYFRKGNTVEYNGFLKKWNVHKDYLDRWQQPKDELRTTVPSAPADFSDWTLSYRDQFYKFSSATVDRADNIRLQDVNFGYTFSKPAWGLKNMRLYANLANVGILWRANKWGLDPDSHQSYLSPSVLPRTVTIGLSATL